MKKRLDQLIVEKGLVESRTKAQAIIMAGEVFVDGKIVDKVGQQVDESAEIQLKEKFPYVSRGALKIEKAYEEFGLDFNEKVICDIGSSTGGFTDFALQHGARKVIAVDVGTGQLDQKLRNDPRVVVMEKTDFRKVCFCPDLSFRPKEVRGEICSDLSASLEMTGGVCDQADTKQCLIDQIDLFVCDVSFISLKKIIPKIADIIHSTMSSRVSLPEAILLIKPQFEVGKKEADRGKGVITDSILHEKVINEIQDCALENGFEVKGVVPSPITGAKGNKEFLIHLRTNIK